MHAVAIALFALALGLVGLGGIQRGDELITSSPYAPRQFLWGMLALGTAAVTAFIPWVRLKQVGYPAYLATILLLLAVFLFPPRNGSRRWIPLGPLSIQPSELAKVAYILALGQYLMFRRNHRTVYGLIPPFLMTVIPVLLILREPDLGTSLLFFPVLFAMLFVAGAKSRHLLATALAGIAILPVLWQVMSAEQQSRVTAVFLQRDDGQPDTGDGYHLHQSKQMLALGGTWGSDVAGMPVSDPAAYRLPASRTDFVFCLVGERWGLAGTLGTIAIAAGLILTGLAAGSRTRDPYARLVAIGITTMFATQVMINTAMTVGLAPITGLTLPFMSYGGSSLVTTSLGLGLLISIARDPGFDVTGQPFRFAGTSA